MATLTRCEVVARQLADLQPYSEGSVLSSEGKPSKPKPRTTYIWYVSAVAAAATGFMWATGWIRISVAARSWSTGTMSPSFADLVRARSGLVNS